MDTLIDLLADSARRFGPSTALSIQTGLREQRWSYARLWDYSGRLATLIRQRGLSKGDRAVIWAPNRPEWALALLGCLRAGVIVVPLDVRSSPDLVSRITKATGPGLIFLSRQTASGQTVSGASGPGPATLMLEDLQAALDKVSPVDDNPAVGADDVAEIMFTSGTTGDPKGVTLTHRNVLSNVLASQPMLPINTSSRLLSLLPLSHMLEQTGGLLVPLSLGAQIIYPVSRQPGALLKTMRRKRVTNVVVVPQALQLFMNAIEREVAATGRERQWRILLRLASHLPLWARRRLFRRVHAQFGGQLAFMMSGGAYLEPELAGKWACLGVPVLQGYGSTETSPVITTNTFRHQRPGSVGRVLPGQEIRIAAGGEIQTRGPNVTRGYWKNHEATASAFEDGWYRTGDLGYLDEDGYLYLRGREKDLIVLANGQNVYPEDVEAVLGKQAGVKDAVVLGLPANGGGVSVHAALLLAQDADAGAAVRAANQLLADHQRVQGFTVWPEEDFPRTHTMKVRKPLVLDFLLNRDDNPEAEVRPPAPETANSRATDLQRVVARLCARPPETLTPEKRLGDDLNLDSLGRVELLSEVEAELGAHVDEDRVGPETTLQDLEAMVREGNPQPPVSFPQWGRRPWCRALRAFLQPAALFPTLRLFYRVKVVGRERLKELQGPVLFAANHNIKMDNPAIIMALPFSWRWRLAIAAAADDIFGNLWWRIFGPLLGNAFPFSREGPVRASLEHLGQLLDDGWSVLIYPEGRNTYGEMDSFKSGTGMLAVESHTSVLPIKVSLSKRSVFDGAPLLSRGSIEVRFGPPVSFPADADYREATAQLEAVIRAL